MDKQRRRRTGSWRHDGVFEIYIKTTPERLWEAITDPARGRSTRSASGPSRTGRTARATRRPFPASSTSRRARTSRSIRPGGSSRRLNTLWSDEVKAEGTSRVTWEIEQVGEDSCRLTVVHDQLRPDGNGEIYGGWPMILSGLKTLLETGRAR